MTDQCGNCQLKGDINQCLAAECFQHENWYAKEQQKRIDNLQAQVDALEEIMMECTQHGELDGSLFNSYMEHAIND